MTHRRPLRIVLVEDNSADVFLIEESLRYYAIEFELRRFESGEAALSYLKAASHGSGALPDVVLLDLHLPGTDGSAILRAIRDESRLARLPVVVLTGACAENVERLDLSHARSVVHKSMDLDEYLRDVAQAVMDLQLDRLASS